MLRKITQSIKKYSGLITRITIIASILTLIAWGIIAWSSKSARQELLYQKMMESERINYNPHFSDPGIIELKESNEK